MKKSITSRQSVSKQILTILTFLTAFLVSFGFFTESVMSQALPQTTSHSPAQPPFYKAQKGNIIVYLLGTHSKGQSSDYPLSDKIMRALSVSQMVIEISEPGEESESDDNKYVEFTSEFAICPDACLRRYVSDEQWEFLRKQIVPDDSPEMVEFLERLSPFMYSLLINNDMAREAGLSLSADAESWLSEQYQQLQKKERGLISPIEMARFFKFSESAKRELVQSTLREQRKNKTERIRKTLHDYQLWRQGDADAYLSQYLAELKNVDDPSVASEIDQVLRINMSQLYMQRLQAFLSPDRPVFLVVETIHLPGDHGILNLLKKEGFTVSKLSR